MFGILSLSAWKIVCWTMRRDIHSIWIISKAALDIEGRWEKLLTVSAGHLWVSPWDFPPWLTHKAHTKYLIFNTLSLNIDNGILCTRRDISIHCSWSVPKPSLDVLIESMVWASLCIFLSLMDLTETIFTKIDSQNALEMPNFKFPLSTKNWIIFYNERRPSLMQCFKTFLRCMWQMGGASLCILLPLMVLTELFSTRSNIMNCTNY